MLFPNGDSIEPLDSVELGIAGLLPRIPATQWELGLDLVTNTGPFFHCASELPIHRRMLAVLHVDQRLQSGQGPLLPRWAQEETSAIRQFVAREGSGGFAAAARPLAALR